ncbi:LysM peptidoglycan-binding domain-containing protein [Microbacterium sp. C7(2022)]|uniref:LysM peptidoglycan-binding domain-containing protein n=1 Tax=Microbacterium sp. C7(2022) TaxID=2992759 RepID=UPI00237C39FB|nr:LysM peptidoglycan-binding domain-containing protein [Microbacterium sp. C7(2022)]MDE0546120.1 LysM peptidoglycan-binding domain-containing protein [Microbacterium sp. C7(2022)]
MNRSQKITAAVSGAVVVGLVALAVPAVAGAVGVASSWQSPVPAAAPAGEVEPIAEVVNAEPAAADDHRDELNYPGCDDIYYPDAGYGGAPAPVDQGPREFAAGDVVLEDGVPVSYTVAPGDAIAAIGARFCVFSTGLFYDNEIHLQGALQPGDVLRLSRDAAPVAYDCGGSVMPPSGSNPVDQGSQYGATGEVVLIDGVPTSYVVAANDHPVAIGERFCIDYATLGPLNGGDLAEIHPGDVLALRP